MDMKAQMLFAMAIFFTPIAIDLVVSVLRGSARYRLNDLLANLTLMLLTIVGSALIAVLTLWIYARVHDAWAVFRLPASGIVTWLVAFVVYDLLYYWAHRVHHVVAILWGVHAVHHSGEDMNFGLAVRQSALGGLTTWYFFLPMAVLGIPSEVYLGISGLQLIYQYFIHNTYVPPLGWLEKVLVTPSQHRVHHARNRLYIDKNYGNILVIWDRLFGSYQPEVREHRVVYGLRHSVGTWNPMTLHTHVFVETAHKARACRSALDKLLCFVKGPSWQPPSLAPERFTEPDDGPSASFARYNPAIPRSSAGYCVVQFVVLTGLVVVVLWNMTSMTAATSAISIAIIVMSAWSLGGLLDGKPGYWWLELARLAAIALVGPVFAAHEGLSPLGAALACLAFAVLGASYLLRFRPSFVTGSPTAASGRVGV